MTIAVITMVYNEKINLPIWKDYYRRTALGAALFVVDHASDDGSTRQLADLSVIPVPRRDLDEWDRAHFISDLQHALLRYYEWVIYTEGDELIVPDPAISCSLEAPSRRPRL